MFKAGQIIVANTSAKVLARANQLFAERRQADYVQLDRLFGAFLAIEWVAGILTALIFTPLTWAGRDSDMHMHVWLAVILGALIAAVPILLVVYKPGHAATRHCIAAAQMLFTSLFIHLTGGRLETHFYIFCSIAFLIFYCDWPLLITASGVVVADHVLRGSFYPISIFGVNEIQPLRWFEHAWWVIVEDTIVIFGSRRQVEQMKSVALKQAEIEDTNQQVEEAVNVLSTAVHEILVSVSESTAGAAQTAAAISETATTIEQVRQTSETASNRAQIVSRTARESAQISEYGHQATNETLHGVKNVKDQIGLIAETMIRLAEKSENIAEIIATVDDLAQQSNLLAFNASIEAAKAGEQGKGFNIVAQEVKRLADQSKQATSQVRSILAEIQKAANAAATATEQGTEAVEGMLNQSNKAGQSILELTQKVSESARAAQEIAVSSQQQLAGVDQVSEAMAGIKSATAQNLTAIEQVEEAANRLSDLGGKLKTLITAAGVK
jgi:methyl-accepting chemotaxis protein